MTYFLTCVLTLLFSLSGPAMGEYRDFRPCSVAAEGMTLADDMAVLRQASLGKGNFGVGEASASDAMRLGRSWVGDGATVASDGKTLLSSDGLRQFRPPSFKPNLNKTQANFEQRWETSGRWQGNGYLDIQ